jgi:hypothetical protein
MAEAQDTKSSDNTIFYDVQNEVRVNHALVPMYSEFLSCFSRHEKTIETWTMLAQHGCILAVVRVTVEPELLQYVFYPSLFCRVAKKWIPSNFTR